MLKESDTITEFMEEQRKDSPRPTDAPAQKEKTQVEHQTVSSPFSMTTNPDGSQRPVTPDDLAVAKYAPHSEPQNEPQETMPPPAQQAPATSPTLSEPVQQPGAWSEFSMAQRPVAPFITPGMAATDPPSMEHPSVISQEQPPPQQEQAPEEISPPGILSTTTAGEEEDYTHYLPTTNRPGHLQHILDEHTIWLASAGKDGRRANFRQADLRGVDLSGSNLIEASFRGADLSGSNLSQSDLRGADFSEAILNQTNLSCSNLTGAILSRADLRTSIFDGAHMQSADMSNAMLIGANLSGLDLSESSFQEADLQSANLVRACLHGANLRHARLIYANLTDADLSGANCREANFEHAILEHAVIEGASLRNAHFQNANVLGVDLSSAAETTTEQRQESLQIEREQIMREREQMQQEWQNLQAMQASVQQREMALQNDRRQVERQKRDIEKQMEGMGSIAKKAYEFMEKHSRYDRIFKYLGLAWFITSAIILILLFSVLGELDTGTLNWVEVTLVTVTCLGIVGLFVASMFYCIKISNNIRRLMDLYNKSFPGSRLG